MLRIGCVILFYSRGLPYNYFYRFVLFLLFFVYFTNNTYPEDLQSILKKVAKMAVRWMNSPIHSSLKPLMDIADIACFTQDSI